MMMSRVAWSLRRIWRGSTEKIRFSEVDIRELNSALNQLDHVASTCEPLISDENSKLTTPQHFVRSYNSASKVVARLSGGALTPHYFPFTDNVRFGEFIFQLQSSKELVRGFFHKELLINQAVWIIDHLADEQLRDRCADLLLAGRDYDRAVSQATLVLEDRLRDRFADNKKLYGKELIDHVMPDEFEKARFRVSENKNEYYGYKKIIGGIFQAYRNSTHHGIQKTDRVDAARICAFIDVILSAINSASTPSN